MNSAIAQMYNRTVKQFYTFIQMYQDNLYRYSQHHIDCLDPAGWRSSLSPATLASCMYSCSRVTQASVPRVIGVPPPLIPLDCCMSYTVSRLLRNLYIYLYIYIGYIYRDIYWMKKDYRRTVVRPVRSRAQRTAYIHIYIYASGIYIEIYIGSRKQSTSYYLTHPLSKPIPAGHIVSKTIGTKKERMVGSKTGLDVYERYIVRV